MIAIFIEEYKIRPFPNKL